MKSSDVRCARLHPVQKLDRTRRRIFARGTVKHRNSSSLTDMHNFACKIRWKYHVECICPPRIEREGFREEKRFQFNERNHRGVFNSDRLDTERTIGSRSVSRHVEDKRDSVLQGRRIFVNPLRQIAVLLCTFIIITEWIMPFNKRRSIGIDRKNDVLRPNAAWKQNKQYGCRFSKRWMIIKIKIITNLETRSYDEDLNIRDKKDLYYIVHIVI